ncbi:beta-1 3-galactosyltransferase 1-like isoform X3 [Biomphalaria pfeifferi]|uniref:Hexosyltransferase n=1 Tax=Biomphalaria pfeifferi TaxID=112525 RepID=A0AAD8FG64_BIOPF|nr:beta-1 3-galactosyltransferase 1-like isoform X3 [Biomphalaria pfeifferi]
MAASAKVSGHFIFLVVAYGAVTVLLFFNTYGLSKKKYAEKGIANFSQPNTRSAYLDFNEGPSSLEFNEGPSSLDVDPRDLKSVFLQMDTILSEEKRSILSFLSQPIINNHNFTYLHNPDRKCIDSRTETLIVVPSAPENFQNRENIRNGDYGNFTRNSGNQAQLLFFIGQTKSNETQHKINNESQTHNDIVQVSFDDIYHNIRLKAVSMLKWTSTFCRQTNYVVRIDDDILVNLTSVLEATMKAHSNYFNFILGRLRFNDSPLRKKGKVYLSREEYPDAFFPPFALGGLLSYPILTMQFLYQAALRVKPIWLDDVYITGLCAQKLGVKLLSDPAFVFKHQGQWAH